MKIKRNRLVAIYLSIADGQSKTKRVDDYERGLLHGWEDAMLYAAELTNQGTK